MSKPRHASTSVCNNQVIGINSLYDRTAYHYPRRRGFGEPCEFIISHIFFEPGPLIR